MISLRPSFDRFPVVQTDLSKPIATVSIRSVQMLGLNAELEFQSPKGLQRKRNAIIMNTL